MTASRPRSKCPAVIVRPDGISWQRWVKMRLCDACTRQALRDRIRESVTIDERGCWIWPNGTKNGYGQLSVNDHPAYAHRVSYEAHVGQIPEGMVLRHSCDVPRCCNPVHLSIGTHLDNVHDKIERGRATTPPVHRGLANSNATLTDEQVAEVRRRVAAGERQRDVARAFGVAQSTVWRLAHGITRGELRASAELFE